MLSSSCTFRKTVLSLTSVAVAAFSSYVPSSAQLPGMAPAMPPPMMRPIFRGTGSGTLETTTKSGQHIVCPLKHTSVSAHVAGNVTRVTVKQVFTNPVSEKIEAVYTFPLSDTGAVDDMLMKVGQRTIHGTIKKKEEARQIYEAAKAGGHVAALLDQERPNIFTQSVANIEPKKEVEVTISYVDLLQYEAGTYTFAFPTVVGPRFNPGSPTGHKGLGWSPDTNEVPDASKITPHVAPKGERAGHDISISVAIDSAVPVEHVKSQLHEVSAVSKGDHHVDVALVERATIPNKDFVLNWTVAADQVRSGYLTHGKDGEGYFNLSIVPPKRPRADQIQPKEMVFLIDCSGSQHGAPLQKAKEVMHYSLDHMNDDDTFQIITFNNTADQLFPQPQKATGEMRKRAHTFIDGVQAQGGTWMAPAVEKACSIPADGNRLRIVSFMTDGFVGNDFHIIGMIKKLRGTSRWFPFGTGNSVNRFLIDNIAKEGGGEADYVYLNSPAAEVGKKFYDKIASPVLTDVKVDFGALAVKEVFPKEITDVWAERPLYFTGRYTKAGHGNITISGFSGGKPYKQTMSVDLPANNASNDVLGSIWARSKVDRLMAEDMMGAQQGSVNKELKDEIVRVALEHHIMTQYTSFVAVEEQTKTKDGKVTTVEVPVEMPDGVEREAVFGEEKNAQAGKRMAGLLSPAGVHQHYTHLAPGAFQGAALRKKAQLNSFAQPSRSLDLSVYGNEGTAAPPPYTTGHGGGAAGGAGYGGFYNAPQMATVSSPSPVSRSLRAKVQQEAPTVVDRRALPEAQMQKVALNKLEPKKDADKESRDEGRADDAKAKSKLSIDVLKWLTEAKSTGTLKVKITLNADSDLKKALAIKGVKLVKRTDKGTEAIVTVTAEALRKLATLESVKSVTKSD